eukprot:5720350-Prymnesium_polylepis.1
MEKPQTTETNRPIKAMMWRGSLMALFCSMTPQLGPVHIASHTHTPAVHTPRELQSTAAEHAAGSSGGGGVGGVADAATSSSE